MPSRMIGAAQRYDELVAELLLRRAEQPDGKLAAEDEATAAVDLDGCWEEMTEEERLTCSTVWDTNKKGKP